MENILWLGLIAIASEEMSITNVYNIWQECYASFGYLETPYTRVPRSLGDIRFELSAQLEFEGVMLIEPTLRSWKAVMEVYAREDEKKMQASPGSSNCERVLGFVLTV